ncbi:MAG: SDR family NAD(P)-dependent oxidoreductase [Pseudomonadota bacterium]
MRLKDKIAIVVGAGQTPGQTIGNGRATSILFAREGAKVLLVDRDEASAQETSRMIEAEGGVSSVFVADVASEADCKAFADTCIARYGRIDILQNVVGIGAGDSGPTSLSEETWNRLMDINLKGTFLSCKHTLPFMREQGSGSIVNISSAAAVASVGIVGYKVSKAGVNALTHAIAMGNAKYGIRANVIAPGLMDTPMAIEGYAAALGADRDEVRRHRDAQVPLRKKMGTGWDTAYASLFLASDEAQFITGIVLPVDGGQAARIG